MMIFRSSLAHSRRPIRSFAIYTHTQCKISTLLTFAANGSVRICSPRVIGAPEAFFAFQIHNRFVVAAHCMCVCMCELLIISRKKRRDNNNRHAYYKKKIDRTSLDWVVVAFVVVVATDHRSTRAPSVCLCEFCAGGLVSYLCIFNLTLCECLP